MKKALFLAVASALLLAGCVGEGQTQAPTPEDTMARIENSTDMPPEAKAQAKAQIEAMNRQNEALTKAQGR